jgi:small-conductance mechanosensitive channel
VILAVVGYFFLIGRYGVRTGDRITISGVTGNVIDIGLVRIYMAELAGTGGDLHSTGRIVVFSNAVLFQNSALFKQLPGMDHVWHRVRLVFVPETEFQLAENRLTEVVDGVFQHHREAADKLHDGTDHAFGARMARPEPEVRLRMMEEGLEATIQYPAPLKRGSVTDDRLIQAIRETVAREPQLKLTESGAPALVANPAA